MKNEIVKYLKENGPTIGSLLPKVIKGAEGDFCMNMSVKPGLNKNIIWFWGVSLEFHEAFNALLIDEKIIDWRPVTFFEVAAEGAPLIVGVPIVTKALMKGKKECWMPIEIFIKK